MIRTLPVLLFFLIYTTSYSQIDFPEDLMIDPYDGVLGQLNVREIVQYKINYKNDTITNKSLDYVISFDSLFNLKSLKYDFYFEAILKPGELRSKYPYGMCCSNDSSELYKFNDNTYNSYEKSFIYENDKLVSIVIKEPKRWLYRGVLDGVYIRPQPDTVVFTEKKFFVANKIVKLEVFRSTDDLIYTKEFVYSDFKMEDYTHLVLTKIINKDQNSKTYSETIIEYKFNKVN